MELDTARNLNAMVSFVELMTSVVAEGALFAGARLDELTAIRVDGRIARVRIPGKRNLVRAWQIVGHNKSGVDV